MANERVKGRPRKAEPLSKGAVRPRGSLEPTENLEINKIYNNFKFGLKTGKYGEKFLEYSINRIALKDRRPQRAVICTLLASGLQASEEYSRFLPQVIDEYRAEHPDDSESVPLAFADKVPKF